MKLLIVHENPLLREGLTSLICQQSTFQEVERVHSIAAAAEMTKKYHPDLVLISFDLPDGSGLDVVDVVQAHAPRARYFFLSNYDDKEHLLAAIHKGARGFLHQSVSPQELLDSLARVADGEAVIPGCLLDSLLDELTLRKSDVHLPTNSLVSLTTRELDVLYRLALGQSNQEIAAGLFLSENTVKNHVHSILTKLKLHNRRQAVQYARQAQAVM